MHKIAWNDLNKIKEEVIGSKIGLRIQVDLSSTQREAKSQADVHWTSELNLFNAKFPDLGEYLPFHQPVI